MVDEHTTVGADGHQSTISRRLGWLVIALTWVATLAASEFLVRRYGGFELTHGRPVDILGPHDQHGEIEFETLNGVVVWRREQADRPPPRAKKEGFRIVVLGDSVLQPARIPEREGTARLLERELNARLDRGPYEVVNLAEGGWNLAQEEQVLLTNALPLAPDLVLVGTSPNDIMEFAFRDGQLLEVEFLRDLDERATGGPLGLIARHSYFYNWLWLRWKQADYVPEDSDERLEQRTVIGPLRRMAAHTREHNVGYAIVCFPFLVGERFETPRDRCPFDRLVTWASEAGVPLLDPIPAYSSHPTTDLRLDDIHLSPLGHRVLTEAVFDWLVQQHLVPYGQVAPANQVGHVELPSPNSTTSVP